MTKLTEELWLEAVAVACTAHGMTEAAGRRHCERYWVSAGFAFDDGETPESFAADLVRHVRKNHKTGEVGQ